jgi:hypothetical protein
MAWRDGSLRRRRPKLDIQVADEQDRDSQRFAPRLKRLRAVVWLSWSSARAQPVDRLSRRTAPPSETDLSYSWRAVGRSAWLGRWHDSDTIHLSSSPVGDKFRVCVDVDLAQWGFSNVREAVQCACRDRDNVSGTDLVFFVANSAPSPTFLHNDDLVIVMPVKWNLAARRCSDKKDRVHHAMLLADEFMRHSSERESLALNDIHYCGWCHRPNTKNFSPN